MVASLLYFGHALETTRQSVARSVYFRRRLRGAALLGAAPHPCINNLALVTPIQCQGEIIGNACPSHIDSVPCGIICLLLGIDNATTAINNEYALLDNGHTTTYLQMIKDTSIANNVIFDTLRNVNGMLSDEVLLALIHRAPAVDSVVSGFGSELFGPAAADTEKLAGLLIQNAPESNIVMNELRYLTTPLPPDSLIKLNQYQDSTSIRLPIIDSIYVMKEQKQNNYTLLAGYATTDTTYNFHQLMDSLKNETDVYLQMMLAGLYMANNSYDSAKIIYDSLPQLTHEIQEITTLREIEFTFQQNGYLWQNMGIEDSPESTYSGEIHSLASADTSIAALQAQVILNLAFGDTILYVIQQKTTGGTGKWGGYTTSVKTGITQTEDSIHKFNVYPNPAGNQLVIEYNFDSVSLDNQFIMYDLLGNQILTESLAGSNGQEVLDISTIPDGLYLYSFKQKQISKQSGKLSIIK